MSLKLFSRLCFVGFAASLFAACGGGASNNGGLADLQAPGFDLPPTPQGDLTQVTPLLCDGGAGGESPCVGGRVVDVSNMCAPKPAADLCGGACKDYAAELTAKGEANICGDKPPAVHGMVRYGICGSYRFLETQGLGIGQIVHRFYTESGSFVGAIEATDVVGQCSRVWGVVPSCALQQCGVTCYAPGFTC